LRHAPVVTAVHGTSAAGMSPAIGVSFRGQTGKHLVPLSLTGFDGHSAAFTRLAYRP
jgi:hypothetical protein